MDNVNVELAIVQNVPALRSRGDTTSICRRSIYAKFSNADLFYKSEWSPIADPLDLHPI